MSGGDEDKTAPGILRTYRSQRARLVPLVGIWLAVEKEQGHPLSKTTASRFPFHDTWQPSTIVLYTSALTRQHAVSISALERGSYKSSKLVSNHSEAVPHNVPKATFRPPIAFHHHYSWKDTNAGNLLDN